ncbi:fluoride efflux transporter CrcB [Helicobacter sp. 11S02596-1]|uniref:fluoride efflux transporter CrcB n=1 Tax=Helicobacter sp. 11S02596-1 TaxID=1476194 RepID=UPI000BA74B80|nr:fluoride efflux transporter CrcB [Helicobacter sp. 11S02596-1]PAF45027.1 camphor resistance protein CrcB [Helicobacter sp. 11S02596-1]
MDFALVALGGGLGSVLRYWLGKVLVLQFVAIGGFPLGTLGVNLIGSFLIGFASFLFAYKVLGADFRVFFIVGVLGGFTTFSSFGMEAFDMLAQKEFFKASVYVLGTNIFGLLLVGLGWCLSKMLFNSFFV